MDLWGGNVRRDSFDDYCCLTYCDETDDFDCEQRVSYGIAVVDRYLTYTNIQ
jgi:hypothetical protein